MTVESQNFIFPYEKDDIVKMSDKLIRDYLMARHFAGDQIKIDWDGGNDSGSVWLNINGVQVDIDWWNPSSLSLHDKIHKYIIECFYDVLDYGSWAGDFNASGSAPLVVEDDFVGFRGTDYYSEDEHHVADCNITIAVPAAAIPENCGTINIGVSEGYDGDQPSVSIYFTQKGVHRIQELNETQTTLVRELEEELSDALLNVLETYGYNSIYDDFDFPIADSETTQTFEITKVSYFKTQDTPKEVELDFLNS